MPNFIAIITRKAEKQLATFPDFPELQAEGQTLDEVRIQAQGALEEHLATTYEEGKTLVAKSLDDVAPKAPSGAVLLALSVTPPKSRAVRINITIPEDLLQAVDRSAAAHSMNRSRFLAKSVEAVVTGHRHGGIQIPLSDEVLRAADKAAAAHDMNRTTFLSRIIEAGVGLREGHGKGHGHHHDQGQSCCHEHGHGKK